jgi:hypothetical protein
MKNRQAKAAKDVQWMKAMRTRNERPDEQEMKAKLVEAEALYHKQSLIASKTATWHTRLLHS